MVSRETTIAEGLAALAVPDPLAASAVERLSILSELLSEVAVPRGYLGPAESDRLVTRHVLEAAALGGLLPEFGAVVDVGSGAGLPGLVLACLRSGHVALVEPQARRAAFLRTAAARLEVDVEIVQARAEDAARGHWREGFAVACARALAHTPIALELTLPFVVVGGCVALLVGGNEVESSPRGSAAASAAAEALGGGPPELRRFEVPGVSEQRWVMIVPKLHPTLDQYPRRAKAYRRRPLG